MVAREVLETFTILEQTQGMVGDISWVPESIPKLVPPVDDFGYDVLPQTDILILKKGEKEEGLGHLFSTRKYKNAAQITHLAFHSRRLIRVNVMQLLLRKGRYPRLNKDGSPMTGKLSLIDNLKCIRLCYSRTKRSTLLANGDLFGLGTDCATCV